MVSASCFFAYGQIRQFRSGGKWADAEMNQSQSATDLDSLWQYRDTIVGKFNGVEVDTLICEPIPPVYPVEKDELFGGNYFHWRLFTKKGTVKDFKIDGTIGIEFVKEGDLDGNGGEEWGFLGMWPCGTWTSYRVLTAVDGEWKLLSTPMMVWWQHIEEGDINTDELATPSDKPGFINAKLSNVIDDCTNWVVQDTVLPVKTMDYNSFYQDSIDKF